MIRAPRSWYRTASRRNHNDNNNDFTSICDEVFFVRGFPSILSRPQIGFIMKTDTSGAEFLWQMLQVTKTKCVFYKKFMAFRTTLVKTRSIWWQSKKISLAFSNASNLPAVGWSFLVEFINLLSATVTFSAMLTGLPVSCQGQGAFSYPRKIQRLQHFPLHYLLNVIIQLNKGGLQNSTEILLLPLYVGQDKFRSSPPVEK